MGWTDSAVRRYVRDAGDLLDDLNELTRCDCTTRDARKAAALGRRMDDLEARIAELRARGGAGEHPPRARRPPGDELPRRRAGPVVGEALAYLLELRLDEGPMSEDQAYAPTAGVGARAGRRRRLILWTCAWPLRINRPKLPIWIGGGYSRARPGRRGWRRSPRRAPKGSRTTCVRSRGRTQPRRRRVFAARPGRGCTRTPLSSPS